MSVFLFVLFSKRSFKGSAQLILYVRQACLSVFLFVLFSKRSFIGSAKLILYVRQACLSVFLFVLFFKAELYRISEATPVPLLNIFREPAYFSRKTLVSECNFLRIYTATPLCFYFKYRNCQEFIY